MDKSKYNGSQKDAKKRRLTIWTRRSLLEKVLLVAVAALFLILIIIVIVSIYSLLDKRNNDPKMCTSTECMQRTVSIHQSLDMTVKPCEDFYQFACGSYKNHHTTNDEKNFHNFMDDLQDRIFLSVKNILENPEETEDSDLKKAKKFYHDCINKKIESTRDNVVQLIRSSHLGDLPLSDPVRNPTFHSKLGVLSAHGRNPFFDAKIHNQSSEILIKISPSDVKMTQLKDDYYFVNNTLMQTEKSTYHKFIFNSLVSIGVKPDSARVDASDLINFETNLANITKQVLDSTYEEYSLNDMEDRFPGLNWKDWFVKTFGDRIDIQKDLSMISVGVNQPQRLALIFELIKSVKDSVVDNYLMWRFVVDLLPLLDPSFRRQYKTLLPIVNDDFSSLYRKRQYYFDEWKQCVHITSEIFRMPITVAFTNSSLRSNRKKDLEDLVDNLKKIFKQMLIAQNWLDKDSKMFLRSKMENMYVKMVNNSMKDPTFSFIMGQLEMKDENNFVDALLQVEKIFFKLDASPYLVKPAKSQDSPFRTYPPLSPTTAYNIEDNMLVISAGMLLTDINYPDSPSSLIYGGLGSVLAKNMYSAYHDHLYQDSKLVSDEDVISKKDEFRYKDKMRCFKGQQIMYSTYSSVVSKPNKTPEILKEMISHDVGLKAAYYAYREYMQEHEKDSTLPEINLTDDQLFFLGFAQTKCEVREKKNSGQEDISLNEILYNSEEFSRAYNCPPESMMNPNDKCAIWE